MEEGKRQRCIYVTAQQKKKLIELVNKNPELISCKVTPDFTHKDSQRLWQNIATLCNAMPGARKTWRQWRKTWHDLKSKTKKKQAETNGDIPITTVMLGEGDQEALDIKSLDNLQGYTDFVPENGNQNESFNDNISSRSASGLDSPQEEKVFAQDLNIKFKNGLKQKSKHSGNCYLNCDMLSAQEERKIKIKEDYLNFKKDYLRQKLHLLKEQTEALKSIASELSKS